MDILKIFLFPQAKETSTFACHGWVYWGALTRKIHFCFTASVQDGRPVSGRMKTELICEIRPRVWEPWRVKTPHRPSESSRAVWNSESGTALGVQLRSWRCFLSRRPPSQDSSCESRFLKTGLFGKWTSTSEWNFHLKQALCHFHCFPQLLLTQETGSEECCFASMVVSRNTVPEDGKRSNRTIL